MFMLSLCTSFNLVEPRNFRQSIFPNIAQLCIAQGSTLATSGDSILWAQAILYPPSTMKQLQISSWWPSGPKSLKVMPVSLTWDRSPPRCHECPGQASRRQLLGRLQFLMTAHARERGSELLPDPLLSSLAYSSLKNEGWRGARGFGLVTREIFC